MKNHTPLEDQIIRKPIDRVAKRVIGRGIEYKGFFKTKGAAFSKTQPPIKAYDKHSKHGDLTGKRFGKFTVIGKLDKENNDKGARWVAKCDCGNYEIYKTNGIMAVIEEKRGTRDQCLECVHLKHIRRKLKDRRELIICKHCGQKVLRNPRKKFCSDKCRYLASGREWIER